MEVQAINNLLPLVWIVDILMLDFLLLLKKKEVYSAEVELRTDIVKLLSERREYRRARRYHKTRYRKPRFLNRRKPEG